MTAEPRWHAPGEEQAASAGNRAPLRHLASQVRPLVTGEDTHGQFAVIETREKRGADRPFRVNTRESQTVYVLEGAVSFHRDGHWLDCPTGAGVLLPKGCEHTFLVRSDEARLLLVLVPAGLEGFYRDLSAPASCTDRPGQADGQAAGPPDVERLITVAARYGVEITGPAPDPASRLDSRPSGASPARGGA
jgi:quercetin dioxygenase-like cupin family protein